MSSPDLGGGRRLRRRPGSLFTSFCFLFLLCFPTFVCVQIRRSSGDSDSVFPAHPSTSFTTTTFSIGGAVGRSLLANTAGNLWLSHPSFDSHLSHCSRFDAATGSINLRMLSSSAASGGYRSGSAETSTNNTITRSDLFSDLLPRFSPLSVTGIIQLRWLRILARKRLMTKAPYEPHRIYMRQDDVLTGDSLCRRCYTRRERYLLLTPFVLKRMDTRFLWNYGPSQHGIDEVLDSVLKSILSPGFVYRQSVSMFYRVYSRISAASVIGLFGFSTHSDSVSLKMNLVFHRISDVSQLLQHPSVTGVQPCSAAPSCFSFKVSKLRGDKLGVALILLVGQKLTLSKIHKPNRPETWSILGQALITHPTYGSGPIWLGISLIMLLIDLPYVLLGTKCSFVVFSFFKNVGLSPWLEDSCRQSPYLM